MPRAVTHAMRRIPRVILDSLLLQFSMRSSFFHEMTALRESQTLPLFTSCLFRLLHDTLHASASAAGHRQAMTTLQGVHNPAGADVTVSRPTARLVGALPPSTTEAIPRARVIYSGSATADVRWPSS